MATAWPTSSHGRAPAESLISHLNSRPSAASTGRRSGTTGPPIRGLPLNGVFFDLPTLADLDGKGDPDVLVVRKQQLDSPEAKLRARKGLKLRPNWSPWAGATGGSNGHGSGSIRAGIACHRWRSISMARGDAWYVKSSMNGWGNDQQVQLALLDGAGKLQRKIPLAPRQPGYDGTLEVVARWLRKVDLQWRRQRGVAGRNGGRTQGARR